MVELQRLAPHDPVPEAGRYALVIRRFAEDQPNTVLVELIMADGSADPPEIRIPTRPDGAPMSFEEAIAAAQEAADREGVPTVYAVDRAAGPRAREVLASGGDHTVHMEKLDDTDLEEGERGSDMRDRPQELGGGRPETMPEPHDPEAPREWR